MYARAKKSGNETNFGDAVLQTPCYKALRAGKKVGEK